MIIQALKRLLSNEVRPSRRERPRIPVMEQKAITLDQVDAAKPPNAIKATQIAVMRKQLAAGLLELSRSSDELATQVIRRL